MSNVVSSTASVDQQIRLNTANMLKIKNEIREKEKSLKKSIVEKSINEQQRKDIEEEIQQLLIKQNEIEQFVDALKTEKKRLEEKEKQNKENNLNESSSVN